MKSKVKPVPEQAGCAGQHGEQAWCHGLAIKPLTRTLTARLLLDQPLAPALIVDFGVESADHYRALKAALFPDEPEDANANEAEDGTADQRRRTAFRKRMVELDAACGDAAKLNAFIQHHAPTYAATVSFAPTLWDYLEGRA